VLGADVFSRASPEHKLRLVSALQQAGEVVAMTGDGVNDAPALRRADIGVAMGLKGTDAARDAGDIVLADDNFASIVSAVHEGRVVYDNLIKFILFVLPTHGGQALVVAAAILFDLTLPLTPPQVLWVNLVTSITLGLALAFEPAEHDIMDRMPRPRGEPLVSAFFIWRVMIVSTMMMTVTLGLFLWELHQGTPLEVARTMAVNAVVAAEMLYLVNSRSVAAPALSWKGLTGNPYVVFALAACVLLQLAYTYSDTLQTVFDSAALTPSEWGKVYAAAALVFAMAELEKWVVRRVQRTRPGSR
jgi:magnesium-transporting ATPase (P-type)